MLFEVFLALAPRDDFGSRFLVQFTDYWRPAAKPFTTTTNMAQRNYGVSILEGQKRTLTVSPRSERMNGLLLFFLPSTPSILVDMYIASIVVSADLPVRMAERDGCEHSVGKHKK